MKLIQALLIGAAALVCAHAAVLPPCHGDPTYDDTPALAQVIANSNSSTWTIYPGKDCYVHFSGATGLPAGTHLSGTRTSAVLHLFAPTDNLFSIGKPDITLEDLTLDMPFTTTTGYHGVLIWVNAQGFQLLHCKIASSAKGGSTGTALWAWNSDVTIERSDFSDFSGQIFITATPGKSPHVRIIGNQLHDNNAVGGNALALASDSPATKSDIPSTIEGNFIWNIAASPTSTGQNGNGVDLDHANKVTLRGNWSKNTRFSCFRAFSSDSLLADANHCIDAGEIGGYSEFSSQHNQWIGNYFENSKSGCLSLTNYDQGGELHTAIGNHMVGCGGAGIHAEASTVLEGNTIDQASTGIVVGYGAFGQHLLVHGNIILDTSGTKTVRGIGIEANTGGDMEIDGNLIELAAHRIEGIAWGALAANGVLPKTVVIRNQSISFENLGIAADTSSVICPDCTVGPVCAGGGSGAFAKRLNGAWVCN